MTLMFYYASAFWTLEGDGGEARKEDQETAAVPNRGLQPSDQSRSERRDQHWHVFHQIRQLHP